MKKLSNPFRLYENFACYACSPDNQQGLQMEFYEDGDYVTSKWEPKTYLQGYWDILHGGIQTTLLDEIASWTVYVKAGTGGVTASINIRFKKPVYVNRGQLTIRGKLTEVSRKFAAIQGELFDHEGNLSAEADIRYFIYPEEVARKKLNYPGRDAFYQ